jgi:mono/diheme cytochrome c family protein
MRHTLLTVFLGTLAVAAIFAGGLLVVSEARLRDVPELAAATDRLPIGAASIEHGRYIARTRGCFGCHGQELQGRVFADEWPWVARAVAPNLAAYARRHDDATLEAAIRHGIGQDGRALWSMPSYNWVHLSDQDLGALLAFLRSAPVPENPLPKPALGWQARWLLATGAETHMADWALDMPPLSVDAATNPTLARGEYVAMTTCNECHGLDLRGDVQDDAGTPDLAIIGAYPEAAFRALMKTGTGLGGREDLGLMTVVAKDRFAYFTEADLTALYAYLSRLGQTPSPSR